MEICNQARVTMKVKSEVESGSFMSDLCHPMGCPWNSPGQNTGVGSFSLFQGIFPMQGSNPGLPHCRRILYQLSHKERSPRGGFILTILGASWVVLVVKGPPANAGDARHMCLIAGSGRYPGGQDGNPLHNSGLENSMDREPGGWGHKETRLSTQTPTHPS